MSVNPVVNVEFPLPYIGCIYLAYKTSIWYLRTSKDTVMNNLHLIPALKKLTVL